MSLGWQFILAMASILVWILIVTRLLLWRVEKLEDIEDEEDEEDGEKRY